MRPREEDNLVNMDIVKDTSMADGEQVAERKLTPEEYQQNLKAAMSMNRKGRRRLMKQAKESFMLPGSIRPKRNASKKR